MKAIIHLIKLANTLDESGHHELADRIDALIKQAKASEDLIKQRFWAKVNKADDGCWLWNGAIAGSGYGICTINGRNYSPHRLSWEWANNAKIPKGYVILHACDQKKCLRPDHLSIGTTQHNADDRVKKDRSAKGDKNGRARLKQEDILKIRELSAGGWSKARIARFYGLARSTIAHILKGRTWKWLESK